MTWQLEFRSISVVCAACCAAVLSLSAAAQQAPDKPAEEQTRPAQAETAAPATQNKPAPAKKPGATDRLELDTTVITGTRELPKVLYIVPWKRPDLGDLGGLPMGSLLDEVLAPVDRDVFRRQTEYYEKLNVEQAAPQEPAKR